MLAASPAALRSPTSSPATASPALLGAPPKGPPSFSWRWRRRPKRRQSDAIPAPPQQPRLQRRRRKMRRQCQHPAAEDEEASSSRRRSEGAHCLDGRATAASLLGLFRGQKNLVAVWTLLAEVRQKKKKALQQQPGPQETLPPEWALVSVAPSALAAAQTARGDAATLGGASRCGYDSRGEGPRFELNTDCVLDRRPKTPKMAIQTA